MTESHLLSTTLRLLRERRGHFRTIAAGAGVEYDWLHKLSQGHIADPGVRKIERLHEYLSRPVQQDPARPA